MAGMMSAAHAMKHPRGNKPKAFRQAVVLIVDDEVDIVLPLARILEKALPTAKIFPALSPEEALEFAKDQPIDLVISDQRMPGMTGEDLLGLLRMQQGNPAGILMSGWVSEGLEYRVRNTAKAVAVLAKPFDAMALVAQVREILAMRGKAQRIHGRLPG